jgi:GT2 family glycosyltransferase
MATTSVIILSHHPGEWLDSCLESVVHRADEVILVDNGSPDRSATLIGESHGARVVRVEKNVGYAAGVNLGIGRSRGDLIALLNDDAVAGPGWLGAAGGVLRDDRVACVVPKVIRHGWYREIVLSDVHEAPGDHRTLGRRLTSVTSDDEEVLGHLLGPGIHQIERSPDGGQWRWTSPGVPFYVPIRDPEAPRIALNAEAIPAGTVCRLLNKAGGYLLRDGVLGDIGDESPDDGRWDEASEPFFGSGTALVARRETVERIGGLAEPFFAYYEDADWCWRARLAGLRVLYDPTSVVEHRHSATSGGSNRFVNRLARRNRALALMRNAPSGAAIEGARRALAQSDGMEERAGLLSKLGWALATRRRLTRQWVLSPQEVWDTWVDVGADWDRGPAREL